MVVESRARERAYATTTLTRPISWDESDDAGLIAGVVDRRHDALEEIFRRHSRCVFGAARRVFSDPHACADATQEVFLRLWERPERYDADRGSLHTFLLMDTRGRCIDRVRSIASQRERDVAAAREAPRPRADADPEIEALILSVQLRDALAELPARERAALECAFFVAGSYVEAAAILGIPEGTVKSQIRSGLQRLSKRLRDLPIDAA